MDPLTTNLPSWLFYGAYIVAALVLLSLASALMHGIHNLFKVNANDFKGAVILTISVIVSMIAFGSIIETYASSIGLITYEQYIWVSIQLISLILSYFPYAIAGKLLYQISWFQSLKVYVVFITIPVVLLCLALIY